MKVDIAFDINETRRITFQNDFPITTYCTWRYSILNNHIASLKHYDYEECWKKDRKYGEDLKL